jgi:hypothetical protein
MSTRGIIALAVLAALLSWAADAATADAEEG